MNQTRDSLIHTLDQSIDTFARIRSSDAMCVAAFDTLKQARAMIARALQDERCGVRDQSRSLNTVTAEAA